MSPTKLEMIFENCKKNFIFATMKRIIWITIIALALVSCAKVPSPVYPVPTDNQLEWQKLETYAFIHFGLNTFNDLEWGYGDTPAATFNPSELDCEQWVATLKAAGMKGVILTAKHHDGFCLWLTKSTDYNISNSPYKNGEGDLVKELSDACHHHGLKFGIYCSPWDRNNARYAYPEYVETYHKQIDELTKNYGPLFEFWFDGANGGNGYYGGANETRSINPDNYYDYQRAKYTVLAHNPSAMIFGGPYQTVRWVGNEKGFAGATNWCNAPQITSQTPLSVNTFGEENGSEWLPAEVDVSIRPGWFYHESEDNKVKTVDELCEIYYNSVGRNANLLLNFPVALNGKIHHTDSTNAVEFYHKISNELSYNLLAGAKVKADNERGCRFSASKVNDDDPDTFWATDDENDFGTITFSMNKPVTISRLMLQEYVKLGQRVKSFYLEGEKDGNCFRINTYDETTTIGYKRIVRFDSVEVDKLRIYFEESRGPLCISNIEAY